METEKTTTIRILESSKQRLSSILSHDESFKDGLEFLLFMWQHPRSAMALRRSRTILPPFSQAEKDDLAKRISK